MRVLRVIRAFLQKCKNHVFLEVTCRMPAFLRQHLALQAPTLREAIFQKPAFLRQN